MRKKRHLSTLLNCERVEDGQGKPSHALLELLTLYGICHDGSWKSIQEETEKVWMSHGHTKELWEIEEVQDKSSEKSYELFTSLGMIATVSAQHRRYDYGVVLGAIVQTVRQRFWFLKAEWERGVRFSILVVLTGDRALDSQLETENILIDPTLCPYPFSPDWEFHGMIPKNETEMMRLVFDQLALPKEWKGMPLMFIDTPKPKDLNRPHTEHTLLHWLASNPLPGSCLCVSSQPSVYRQDTVLRGYLPSSFSLDSVGEGFSFEQYLQEKQTIAIILAELALRIKLYAASTRTSSVSLSKAPCL